MSNSSTEANNEDAMNAMKTIEEQKTPKLIRILTVCAYLFTVSLAAIALSVYYIFLWDPKITPSQVPKKH